jgi:hypothetical protein
MKALDIMNAGHDSMVRIPDDGYSHLIALIILAGISGAIGGCANFAHIFIVKEHTIRWMKVGAYALLGFAFGIMSFAVLSTAIHFGIKISLELSELMGISMVFGFGGTLALTGTNLIVKWTTKRFGNIEVQFTARKDHEERRDSKTGKVSRKKG